ncbi:MAG: hypothetical protein ACNS60_09470 [Candidatus Cyclobacteriaceae bacterium M2_1C_046]
MKILITSILLLVFLQPSVKILKDDTLLLTGNGVYKIKGTGTIKLMEGKKKLVFDELLIDTKDADINEFPLLIRDKKGNIKWELDTVPKLPAVAGTTIIDSDNSDDSSISSTDEIIFYLALSPGGEVVLFQPID